MLLGWVGCEEATSSISESQLPSKSMIRMMMMLPQYDNHNRPFSSHGRSDFNGPTFNKLPPMTNNIYDDVLANVNAASGVLRTVLQQPFDIFATWTHSTQNYSRSSPSEAMAASLGFAFTDAQWKELERQAMIYKYMVASVPVPSDLLTVTRNLSASAVSQTPCNFPHPCVGSEFNLRLSNGSDLEPGRCKRTDGKKWRCCREVAPDQKYCERHMHRGRPRSRKHVENRATNTKKKPRIENQATLQTIFPPTTLPFSNPSSINNNDSQSQFLGYTALPYHHSSVSLDESTVKATNLVSLAPLSSTDEKARSFWVEKGETSNSDPRWKHLMQSKMELNSNTSLCDTDSSVLGHSSVEEPFLDLNSYANFDTSQQDGECGNLFLVPDVVSFRSSCFAENPRSFIDAWGNKESSVSSIGKLSPSSLTLTMGGLGYNSINNEMGSSITQMGSGYYENSSKFLDSWHIPPWVGSPPPGGPLGEVLGPSSLTATPSAVSNQSSPITGNGDTESLVATTMSSSSMVIQKTHTSLSADSSGSGSSSSPTFGSSKEKAEIALF